MKELENISSFLTKVDRKDLAVEVLDTFGKHAVTFDQYNEVSESLFKIKDYDRSIIYGEKAYTIAPSPEHMYNIRSNLINLYNHNNMPERALRYIKANEHVMESDIDRDFEKAFALFLSNRKSEAAQLLRSLVDHPSLTEEQAVKLDFNLGTYDMIDGDFHKGLERFLLSGEKMKIWDHTTIFSQDDIDKHNFTRWDGTIEKGRNILLVAEAGIGDEIINVRFYHKLKELGMNPLWASVYQRPGLSEFLRLNGIDAINGSKEIPESFIDFVAVPSMHVPLYLNSTYDDLWDGPYLTNTDPLYDDKWSSLTKGTKKKIGIRWQGNPSYDQDLHRSIPLKDIYDAVKHVDADFYSLQRDTGLEELVDFPGIIDIIDQSKDILDLASFIKNLDVVITSCTSVAHIAAAMGKEVFVWVPISCYYVWCNPTKSSPWYGDTCHVLYQQKPREWANCIEEMRNMI